MTTCTHCGSYFTPKYRNMKLCFNCWQKRERAFKEYDDLVREIRVLRFEVHRASENTGTGKRIPAERIRQLLRLCHPDRHHGTSRETTATEVTQWLNEMKRNA
jgi:hypothetical protein